MFITKRPIAPLVAIYFASILVNSFSSERERWDLLSVIAFAMAVLSTLGVIVVAVKVLIDHRAAQPALMWCAALGGLTTVAVYAYGLFQDEYSAEIGAGLVVFVGLILLVVGAFATVRSRESSSVRPLDTDGAQDHPRPFH